MKKIHNLQRDFVSYVQNFNTCVLDFCFVPVVWSVLVHGSFYDF